MYLKDREAPFAFAGLWEAREDLETFTILTTRANEALEEIHDRMPVILPDSAHEAWLDPTVPADELLVPYPSELTAHYEVTRSMGNPGYKLEEAVAPI